MPSLPAAGAISIGFLKGKDYIKRVESEFLTRFLPILPDGGSRRFLAKVPYSGSRQGARQRFTRVPQAASLTI